MITKMSVELNYSKNILMIKILVLDSLGRFKGKKAFRGTCSLLLRTSPPES